MIWLKATLESITHFTENYSLTSFFIYFSPLNSFPHIFDHSLQYYLTHLDGFGIYFTFALIVYGRVATLIDVVVNLIDAAGVGILLFYKILYEYRTKSPAEIRLSRAFLVKAM